MIKKLSDINNIKIHSVKDKVFKTYGRIVQGYDFSNLIKYMEDYTSVPEKGNMYITSVEDMEKMGNLEEIRSNLYGDMPIQIGYCNGKNTTYNGFEYHKGSEINIAVTDFMLVLGHTWDIENNTYNVDQAEIFYVEKGTAIEMYQTTLHLSPCRVSDEGFKDIVILPKGTNTPLKDKKDQISEEDVLLLQTNKWVLAHPEREPLIRQGAHPGVVGKNIELLY